MSSSGWNSDCPDFKEDESRGARKKAASIGVATSSSAFLAIDAVAGDFSSFVDDSVASIDRCFLGVNRILRGAVTGDAITVNSKIPRSGQKK